jgi:hypothetical protein
MPIPFARHVGLGAILVAVSCQAASIVSPVDARKT